MKVIVDAVHSAHLIHHFACLALLVVVVVAVVVALLILVGWQVTIYVPNVHLFIRFKTKSKRSQEKLLNTFFTNLDKLDKE